MDSGSPIEFVNICGNGFYFNEKGPEKDVDSDDFAVSCNKPLKHLIQSKDNKCLLLDDQRLFRAQNITKSVELGCKFFLQIYKDSTSNQAGRPVILYSKKDNNNMVVCCNEKNEIYPKEMDLPSTIKGSEHNAVFYMRRLAASNMYTFESSAYLGMFLGFEPDENNPSMKKLVLYSEGYETQDCVQVKLVDCIE